jgi:hypothetical protein
MQMKMKKGEPKKIHSYPLLQAHTCHIIRGILNLKKGFIYQIHLITRISNAFWMTQTSSISYTLHMLILGFNKHED